MSATMLRVVGQDAEGPLLGGGRRRLINLDYAATAPALEVVRDAVEEFLPWYASVHRGAGWKSQLSTRVYEAAREAVATFVNARGDDIVVFTRNTTDSLNLLCAALPADCQVVAFGSEHHANLLPWRRRRAVLLETPDSPAECVALLDDTLAGLPAGPKLVAVTGASNVTGELWPVAALADVAHLHGARIVVDAAQLAPHAPVDISGWDVDYVAFSGHKLYAPYGAGVLVGRRDWLSQREPFLAGGGAVRFVTTDDVQWADLPERQEAGSPNVIGAVAIGAACRALTAYGMDKVAAEEAALEAYASAALTTVPGLVRYRLWDADHPRIGVLTFNIEGMPYGLVAAALAGEHGISMRDGCFCAHPLMMRLLEIDVCEAASLHEHMRAGSPVRVPGAVRMSTGVSTTTEEIDQAVAALRSLAEVGPTCAYDYDEVSGHYLPLHDDRVWPTIAALACAPSAPMQHLVAAH
jgi:selenocysteine lyase/cysteine desulfurase